MKRLIAVATAALIASILASATDHIQTGVPYPGDAQLRRSVTQNSGIIAHWNKQLLFMPQTAKALGVDGDYIDVTGIVIDNNLSVNDSRLIYVTVATPSGVKRLVFRAYDVANVCVEGQRLS